MAATPHAYRQAFTVCWLDAAKIGIRRYSTTMASTDHTAWATADAAGGAVTAVRVTHEWSGHNARRPATPMNSRIDATTRERTVHPGLVCRIGSSVVRFCAPYRA